VKISRLLGKNKEFIEQEIPHLDKLLRDTPEAALHDAEIIVIGHADAEARQAIVSRAKGRRIIDLSGYAELRDAPGVQYEGICW
jgi:GDP-mannose 6-dehydrogenase